MALKQRGSVLCFYVCFIAKKFWFNTSVIIIKPYRCLSAFLTQKMQSLRVRRIVPHCDLGVPITLRRKDIFLTKYSQVTYYLDGSKLLSLHYFHLPDVYLTFCVCSCAYVTSKNINFSKHAHEARVIGNISLDSLIGTRETFWLSSPLSALTNLDTSMHIGLRSERSPLLPLFVREDVSRIRQIQCAPSDGADWACSLAIDRLQKR